MKVKKLIEELQKLDQEKEIMSWDYDLDYCDLIEIFDFTDIVKFEDFKKCHESFELQYFTKNKPDYLINVGNQE